MSNKLTSNPKNKVVIGSIIVQKKRILAGLVPELEAWNQFQWQKIGYNQVKYKWRKLTNNSKQGLCRNYHCGKRQNPMWFGSGMRFRTPECVKQMNKWTNTRTNKHMTLTKTIIPFLPFGLGGDNNYIV